MVKIGFSCKTDSDWKVRPKRDLDPKPQPKPVPMPIITSLGSFILIFHAKIRLAITPAQSNPPPATFLTPHSHTLPHHRRAHIRLIQTHPALANIERSPPPDLVHDGSSSREVVEDQQIRATLSNIGEDVRARQRRRARLRILGWTGDGMGASSSTSLEVEKRREGRRALRMEKMGLEEDVEGVLSVRTESRLMRDSEVG